MKTRLTSGFTWRVKPLVKPAEFDKIFFNTPYRKADLSKLIRVTLDETS